MVWILVANLPIRSSQHFSLVLLATIADPQCTSIGFSGGQNSFPEHKFPLNVTVIYHAMLSMVACETLLALIS